MGNIYRDLDALERSIGKVSQKYDTYAKNNRDLPSELNSLYFAAETARDAADSALVAARQQGESARMEPVERAVKTCVKTAKVFGAAVTEFEDRQAYITGQVKNESDRVTKLEARMKTLARNGNLPRDIAPIHVSTLAVLRDAKRSCDGNDLQVLMQVVGKLNTAVAKAEKAAK